MSRWCWGSLPLFAFLSLIALKPLSASGQMVTAGFPMVGVRDGFSERIGSNWSLTGPGIYNWWNHNSGGGAHLGFNFSQSSSRSMTSTTPMVTGFSGSPMFFQNSLQRPFVTSLIPTVGNAAGFQDLGAANTIRGRMLRGEFSMRNGKVIPAGGAKPAKTPAKAKGVVSHRPLVDAAPPTRAEREAQEEAAQTEQLLAIRKYLQKGKEAEAKGKKNVAKLYYQMAARRAEGDLKHQALASIERVTH